MFIINIGLLCIMYEWYNLTVNIGETGAPWDFNTLRQACLTEIIAICSPAGQWYQN